MEAEGTAIAERDTGQRGDAGEMPASDPPPVETVDSPPPEPMRLVARGPSDDMAVPIERTYRMADLSHMESSLKPDNFHDASYDTTLETCIREVLEQEAPVLDKVLVDRIARVHGFKRSGRLIRERVLELAERHYHFEPDPEPDHGHFVWLAADDPDRWNIYRVPQGEDDIRFIEELAPEEIVAMARTIQSDDPVVDIARAFGIRRLSASAKSRLVRVLGADAAR